MMELIPLSVHTQWEALAATLKKGGGGWSVCLRANLMFQG